MNSIKLYKVNDLIGQRNYSSRYGVKFSQIDLAESESYVYVLIKLISDFSLGK